MTKAKISEYDAVAANNTDVNGVNIAENCPPSGMNNMGREIMAALKRFQVGSDGDGVTVGGNLVVSGTSTVNTFTAGPVSATTLNTSGAVVFNDAGADVDFRVEGDTNANLLFVDAGNDRVGIGTSSPRSQLTLTSSSGGVFTLENSATAPVANDYFGRIQFYSNDASGASSGIKASIDALVTTSQAATDIVFSNCATASTALTERMRATSDGYLRMASGSGGIQFNGDTAAANALDDYEEGTWTPVISDGTNNATMGGSTSGRYTKIGNLVTVTGYVVTTALGSVSGNVRITGLPFTGGAGAGNYAGGSVGYAEGLNISANQVVSMYVAETNYIVPTLFDSTAGTTNLQASEWSADGGIFLALTYRT